MNADRFRKAAESKDVDAMVDALTADVVLNSPVAFKPFRGRDEVRLLFTVLMQVFEDFRYVGEFDSEDGSVLRFRCRVGTRDVEGIDLLHFTADGLCDDFTVMVRPLSAAIALAEAVGPRLAEAGYVKS